jgi:uncharacterized membrane protein YbhN (UPF0104 family)
VTVPAIAAWLVAGRRPRRLLTAGGRFPWWVVPSSLVLVAAAAAASAASVDGDSGSDLLGLGRSIGADLLRLRWQFVAIVVVLAGLHYVATAVAARAASGARLPFGEILLVQLAASAANRLTPAGLGGSAVTARYFTRRGLNLAAAVGALAMLTVLGALADLGVLAGLVVMGRWLGANGAPHEVAALARKVAAFVAPLRSPWTWLGVAAALAAGAGVRAWRHSGGHDLWTRFCRPIRHLARRPSTLGLLLVASGSTTLILAFAFAASTAMVPGSHPTVGLGAMLVGFMLGSAAGGAVPVPAGLGSTEAALIGVLVSVHVAAAEAVQVVLIFRLLTFWLPAVIGILATRQLRSQGAL